MSAAAELPFALFHRDRKVLPVRRIEGAH